jgi:hypothetical protein
MSAWASKHVPEESNIASRKPSMSFIYGEGRSFYGIYKFPTMDADTVLNRLERKGEDLIFIEDKLMKSRKMPVRIEYTLKLDLEAFFAKDDSLYVIYNFPESKKNAYLKVLRDYKLPYSSDINSLRKKFAGGGIPAVAVVPDSLVNRLLRNNVDYLIRGSLRVVPAKKTQRIVNTIHRYMYYMEQKYLGIFTKEHQIGQDGQEPAYLFKINWDRFGLKKETGQK